MKSSPLLETISKQFNLPRETLGKIIEKAVVGGETNATEQDDWLQNRFAPNTVILDKEDYARSCINALKSIFNLAGTDYGSSRQRDFAQLWADIIRGYLGETAFAKFLDSKWGIVAELDHAKGKLDRFLPMDIHKGTSKNW